MPKNKKDRYQILLLVIVVAALGGGAPVFSKIALEVFPIFTFIFLRFAIASIIIIPLFIRAKEKISKKDLWPIIVVSLFGAGNIVFFAFGIKQTTVVASQVLYAVVPVLALVASVLVLRTSFQKKKIVGVFLGLIGVCIIIVAPTFGDAINSVGTLTGNLLVLTAVMFHSLYTVFSKKVQKQYSSLTLTTAMVVTTLIMQSLVIASEASQYPDALGSITIEAIIGLFYVAVVGTVVYFFLYQEVIKKANPVVASMTFYLQPIFGFLWAFFLLGERLTLSLIVGGILAFLGAGVVTQKNTTLDTDEKS